MHLLCASTLDSLRSLQREQSKADFEIEFNIKSLVSGSLTSMKQSSMLTMLGKLRPMSLRIIQAVSVDSNFEIFEPSTLLLSCTTPSARWDRRQEYAFLAILLTKKAEGALCELLLHYCNATLNR